VCQSLLADMWYRPEKGRERKRRQARERKRQQDRREEADPSGGVLTRSERKRETAEIASTFLDYPYLRKFRARYTR